ncbi:MAG: hypothetical protein COA88_12695 [Kordia sp.]|nr:MAG: hypothetical protein COA88_12695 [Kordia sp.]
MKMKKIRKFVVLMLMGVLTLNSCSNEESVITPVSDDSESLIEARQSGEIDVLSEGVSAVIEEVYTNDELSSNSRMLDAVSYLPGCVTITTVVTAISKEKTIDFGEGCELPNGHIIKGIIYMSYQKDMTALTKEISVSFQNFYVNEISIQGVKTVFRERSNTNSNPQSTFNVDILVTWPDGAYASRVGERVREWIEGYGSGNWGDNVFLITGNRTTTFRNGNIRAGEVVQALRRELACNFLVSGIVELQRNNNMITLDFGDGLCDNEAIVTLSDGTTHVVYL